MKALKDAAWYFTAKEGWEGIGLFETSSKFGLKTHEKGRKSAPIILYCHSAYSPCVRIGAAWKLAYYGLSGWVQGSSVIPISMLTPRTANISLTINLNIVSMECCPLFTLWCKIALYSSFIFQLKMLMKKWSIQETVWKETFFSHFDINCWLECFNCYFYGTHLRLFSDFFSSSFYAVR